MLVAVLGLHELSYLLAFGDQAASTLERTGHGYLGAVVPFSGLVLAVGLAWCLLQAATGPEEVRGHRGMSRWRLWLLSSAALLAVFAGQELIEGLMSSGHHGALKVVFGAGGWTVLPLVLALGGLVTLAAGVAEQTERTIRRARDSRQPRPLPWDAVERPRVLIERTARCALEGLARHLAGRGPPAASHHR